MKMKYTAILLSLFFLNACTEVPCDAPSCVYAQQPKEEVKPVEKYYANEENTISLQNLRSRVIVHCYTTKEMLAETCAQAYENEGFVRFREIPYKTADYDFLKQDTFPTRRWRRGERTPRW